MGERCTPANRRQRCCTETGAAAVEFALVLPILLVVVFGIITYGLIFASQISLNAAARDAARAGVVEPLSGTPLTCAGIAQLARGNTHPLGAAQSAVKVKVTSPDGSASCTLIVNSSTVTGSGTADLCSGSAGSTSPLVVELTYEAKSPVPLVPGTDTTLSSKGEFQCEYS
jgi:Flp pilus assembly protein TadG